MTAETPDENSDSHERLVWLDQLCDRFEDSWGTEKQISVEFLLKEISPDRRKAALNALLKLEVELRGRHGDAVTPEELAKRFPADRDVVQSVMHNPSPPDSLAHKKTKSPAPTASQTGAVGATSGGMRIPRRLGRYRIVRKLGQGAMGSVFLAHDDKLDRQVAIKIPRGDVQRNKELRARFQREAQAAAALNHPNICPIYDIGQVGGIHYICMGYIEGFSLTRYAIAESGLSEQRIAELVLKLAKALAVAHEGGFIHRDLKPANVMIDVNDEPVILDFGLARRIDRHEDTRVTQTGTTIGSPAYMSPEQVDGDQSKIGKHSDIYSLGVILYELLTGRIPFEGSMASVLGQIMTKEPDKPSEYRRDLSVRLENICQRMMAKDAAKRHPSMHAVVASLQEYLEKYAAPSLTAEIPISTSGRTEGKGIERKQRIEKLISSGDYGQAEKLMVALSRETDDALIEVATWAAEELPKLRKIREEVRAGRQEIYNTAVRLMKAHDYEQAVRLLEEYPFDMRTPKMQELLEQAESVSHVIERLRVDIKRARTRADNSELRRLLLELLELKPSDRRAKNLLAKLNRRSAGPISKMLGDRQPTFLQKTTANVQWLILCAAVVLICGYPAYQWSKDYLLGTVSESDSSDRLIDRPKAPDPPKPTGPPPNLVLDLEGKEQHIAVDSLTYNADETVTMEAWVLRPVATPGWYAPFSFYSQSFDEGGTRKDRGFFPFVSGNKEAEAVWHVFTNKKYQSVGAELNVGSWCHVAIVAAPTQVTLFVDGHLSWQQTLDEPLLTPEKPLLIGAAYVVPPDRNDYASYHDFRGRLDEIRISRGARYTTDFTPVARHEPDSTTLALYHCDELIDGKLRDASGNGHHGTGRDISLVADSAFSTRVDSLAAEIREREAENRFRHTVDLLALADPAKVFHYGDLQKTADRLSMSPNSEGCILQVPWVAPRRYRLSVVATRTTTRGGLYLCLPFGKSSLGLILEGRSGSGFQKIDGGKYTENGTLVRGSGVFTSGTRSNVVVDVGDDSVIVTVDGRPYLKFEGSPDRVSPDGSVMQPNYDCPALRVWDGEFDISEWQLSSNDDRGTPLSNENSKLLVNDDYSNRLDHVDSDNGKGESRGYKDGAFFWNFPPNHRLYGPFVQYRHPAVGDFELEFEYKATDLICWLGMPKVGDEQKYHYYSVQISPKGLREVNLDFYEKEDSKWKKKKVKSVGRNSRPGSGDGQWTKLKLVRQGNEYTFIENGREYSRGTDDNKRSGYQNMPGKVSFWLLPTTSKKSEFQLRSVKMKRL